MFVLYHYLALTGGAEVGPGPTPADPDPTTTWPGPLGQGGSGLGPADRQNMLTRPGRWSAQIVLTLTRPDLLEI